MDNSFHGHLQQVHEGQQQQFQQQQFQQQQFQQQQLMARQDPGSLAANQNASISAMSSMNSLHAPSQGMVGSLSGNNQSASFAHNNLHSMKNENFNVGASVNMQPGPVYNHPGMNSSQFGGVHNNPNFAVNGNFQQEQFQQSMMRNPSSRPQSSGNTGQEAVSQNMPPNMVANGMNPLAMQNSVIHPTVIPSNSMSGPQDVQSNDMMMQQMMIQNQQMNPTQIPQLSMYQMHAGQIQPQPMQQTQSMTNNQTVLTTEQQLMQQKHLIDSLERQIAQHRIAQHQSQVNANISKLPNAAIPSADKKTTKNNQGSSSKMPPPLPGNINPLHQTSGNQPQQVPSMLAQDQVKPPTMNNADLAAKNSPMTNFLPINALAQNQPLIQSCSQPKPQTGMNQQNQNQIAMNIRSQTSTPLDMSQHGSGIGVMEPLKSMSHDQLTMNPSVSSAPSPVRSPGSFRLLSSSSPPTWEWQSPMDMPDRKRILGAVLEVIKHVKDGGQQNLEKLSRMAKRLEEFLYKNAKSKEEYLDLSTLRKRLQALARQSGPKRSGTPSNTSNASMSETALRRISLLKQRNMGAMDELNTTHNMLLQRNDHQTIQGQTNYQPQDQHHFQETHTNHHQQQHVNNSNGGPTDNNANDIGSNSRRSSMASQEQQNQQHSNLYNPSLSQAHLNQNNAITQNSREGELDELGLRANGTDSNKAIQHQVNRLILLRHASKCTKGAMCTVKKCPQMISLWNHMKICRDKDCKTEHCLTSRCILNHYRICKEKNRASKCKICSPVMRVIEQQDSKAENSSNNDNNLLLNNGNSDLNDPLMRLQPMRRSRPREAPNSNNPQNITDEKVLTLSELQAEQQKLNQQRQFLNRLQKQQEAQQHHHRISNIAPDSEEGLKLRKQQILIQKCHDQFLEDQNLLKRLIFRHSQLAEQKKHEQDISNESFDALNHDNIESLSHQQNDPLSSFLTDLGPSEENYDALDINSTISRKRSMSDLSMSQCSKILKTDDSVSRGDNEPYPMNSTDTHDNQKNNTGQGSVGYSSDDSLKRMLVSQQLLPLISSLMEDDDAWVFNDPVDPVAWNLPDYFEVIKTPMDLNSIKRRLDQQQYGHVDDVRRDTSLVFDNAILYNGEKSDVGIMAIKLLEKFNNSVASLLNTT